MSFSVRLGFWSYREGLSAFLRRGAGPSAVVGTGARVEPMVAPARARCGRQQLGGAGMGGDDGTTDDGGRWRRQEVACVVAGGAR